MSDGADFEHRTSFTYCILLMEQSTHDTWFDFQLHFFLDNASKPLQLHFYTWTEIKP